MVGMVASGSARQYPRCNRPRSKGETMTGATEPTIAAIAHAPGQGEALWVFGGLATIKSTSATTGGRVTVTEQLAPRGVGSPLHVHHREDEWFYVLEGELTFWVGGETIVAAAGAFVYGPKDVPHTFLVSSEEARFLLVAEPAGFEEFMRACGQPAERLEIPPPPTEPPDVEALTRIAAGYGIDIIGPPGIPD
jgi:quercetin dioxygenase-like cupin family protein